MMNVPKAISLSLLTWLISYNAGAVEQHISGLIDVRYSYVDGIESHLDGNYGKFRYEPDHNIGLAHGAFNYQLSFDNPLAVQVIGHAFIDDINSEVGIEQAFLKYQALPNNNGHRFSARAGIIYPRISLENNATGWTSPYTLSFSTLNSWIGEEIRYTGLEFNWDKLGKFNSSKYNFGLSASVYKNNDTAGALLSWRGWTQSGRQTLWHERVTLPPVAARFGGWLQNQADKTDPFIELDHRYGYDINARLSNSNNLKINAGYYDNNADTLVFKNGQYVWHTKFFYSGINIKLSSKTRLLSQFLTGDTLMTSPKGRRVVDNDYRSAYVLLTHQQGKHQYTTRLEEFSVTDKDNMPLDNNNEYGKAWTLSYQYRLNYHWFLQGEYNWLQSSRPARVYAAEPVNLIERQWQLAAKYYF